MSISKYVDRWSKYLQSMVLTGHHYNDCFFFQQLFWNSHSIFKRDPGNFETSKSSNFSFHQG